MIGSLDLIFLFVIGSMFGIFVAIKIMTDWRTGVIMVFVALLAEDVIRRQFSAYGLLPEVTLIKDAALLLTYLSFLGNVILRERRSLVSFGFPFWIGLVILLTVAGVATLTSQAATPLAALLGTRGLFWYVPLALLGYEMFRQEAQLATFTRRLVYLAIPLALFAAFQFVFADTINSPLMRPLEGTVASRQFVFEDEAANVSRATAVFGSPLRLGGFALLLFLLGLALLHAEAKHRFWTVLAIGAAALGVLLSGQRAAMFLLPLALLWFLLRWRSKWSAADGRHLFLRRVGLAILPVLVVLIPLGFITEMRVWLLGSIPHLSERTVGWLPQDIRAGMSVGWTGLGFGIYSPGVQHIGVVRPLDGPYVPSIESGISRLWVEMGVLGVIAFYVFTLQTLFGLRQMFVNHAPAEPLIQALRVAIYVYLGCILIWFSFVHQAVFSDATVQIPFWFFAGIAFRRWETDPVIVKEATLPGHLILPQTRSMSHHLHSRQRMREQ